MEVSQKKVLKSCKMSEPIKQYIEAVYDQYPMKELEELLNIELMIPCTIARQKAKMHQLINKVK